MQTNRDGHAGVETSLSGVCSIGKAVEYRSLYFAGKSADGRTPPSNTRRPVLLLGGTSISIEDQKELLLYLQEAGLDVASIETPMGGLFDIGINPMKLRPLCMCDFIERLKTANRIQGLDIIAHSYAAFEVVRTLSDAPLTYRHLVRSILLINPPGFKERTGFAAHASQTIGGHIVRGLMEMVWRRFTWGRGTGGDARPGTRSFAEREIHGIVAMSAKGMKNPVRTIREIKDIVTYKLARPIQTLCSRYGYDFNLFLNADDRMVPVAETLRVVRHILPPQNIKVVAGGHNDILFQQWQRAEFLSFLESIRARKPI
ncbi:MAG: hypothetical protein C4519_15775 [Desulfobacteraceae bacterium]|nr:MAG: hypothetical protein C4519_15775 [Desulfobacteraceae bacterium]